MKAYVLWYPPLNRPINFGFEYELIECEPSIPFWTEDEKSWEAKTSIQFRQLRPAEKSIAVKHLEAYQRLANSTYDYALILEDDTILVENFMPILESRIGTLSDEKSKWDFLFIGSCCNLRISQEHIIPGQYWYKKSYPATKCADSYVIKRKAAQACLEELPYTLPIDWELSYIIEKRNMTTYWLEPPIVVQGSQNGTYESSIQCSM